MDKQKKPKAKGVKKIPKRAELPPPVEFFDRQPEEGPHAWYGFQQYRDMGPHRSLAKVAEKLGIAVQMTERWSQMYRWVHRVALWQRQQDDIWKAAREEELRGMAKRHAALAGYMTTILHERLKNFRAADLSARHMAQWVKVATDIERLALGAPTQHINVTDHERRQAQAMTPEERHAEIRRLTAQLGVCGND